MELFVPIDNDHPSRLTKRFRITITEDGNDFLIEEQRKYRNEWRSDPDGYYHLYVPIKNLSSLIEQLQRAEKLLVLK